MAKARRRAAKKTAPAQPAKLTRQWGRSITALIVVVVIVIALVLILLGAAPQPQAQQPTPSIVWNPYVPTAAPLQAPTPTPTPAAQEILSITPTPNVLPTIPVPTIQAVGENCYNDADCGSNSCDRTTGKCV